MLNIHSRKSPWKLSEKDVEKYRSLSLRATLDFLTKQKAAACVQQDPTGKSSLLAAKWIRKNLKMLDKRGKLEPSLYLQALKALQPEDESPSHAASSAS